MTMTLKDRTKDWTTDNPLRRWRHRERLSMMDASALLNVAMSSVQHWEQGAHMPNDESLDRLAVAMKVKPATLRRSWREWYNRRPSP